MARLIPTETPGRFALVDEDTIIGYGHLEIPFIPPSNDGAILGDVQFILEPRAADRTNEQMMREAHASGV